MVLLQAQARVTLSSITGDRRTWEVFRNFPDFGDGDANAGGSMTFTMNQDTDGLAPPDAANQEIVVGFYIDNGSTLVREFRINPTITSSTLTFHGTHNGLSSGTARCGTLRIRITVEKTNGGPTATYSADSDGGSVPPTGGAVETEDRGWVRFNTGITTTISNDSYSGPKTEPAVFSESLYHRVVSDVAPYQSYTMGHQLNSGTGTKRFSTSSSSSGTWSRLWSGTSTAVGRVNEGFDPSEETCEASGAPQTSSLTGNDWMVPTSETNDFIDVDPRLTCEHLFQLDDNSYGTPPLSKLDTSGERPSTSIAYLGTHIRDARGSKVGDVLSGGVSGITVDIELVAALNGDTISRSATTTTEGGEVGWTSGFMAWTSPLPGGAWDKSVVITSPFDINAAGYLLNNTAQYQLLASRSPFVELIVGGGMPGANGDHFSPGKSLIVGGALYQTKVLNVVAPDPSPAPSLVFVRLNQSTGRSQYLDSNGVWQDANGATLDTFSMTVSPTDANVFTRTVTNTDDWGEDDVFAVVTMFYQAVSYSRPLQIINVSGESIHSEGSSPAFDPIAFGLHGIISQR
jgi:hypothetical protein